jgi:methyl-accepting chemotaxis protein
MEARSGNIGFSLAAKLALLVGATNAVALAACGLAMGNLHGWLAVGSFVVPTIGLVTWMTARALLTRRLSETARRIDALATGDFEAEVRHGGADEVGAVAHALDRLRNATAASSKVQAEREAERAIADVRRDDAETMRAAEAKLQAAVMRLVGTALARIADGDLTARLKVDLPAEHRKLRDDFNLALDRLADMVAGIAVASGGVREGATEIRRGAADFATRAGRQAAGIGQTVAAIEEITGSVARTISGAAEARTAVGAATEDAGRSDVVVRQAIEAMGRIEKSSQEVNKIIGVIDEIAFQTNLLALNAGVEAARAGDAGRGFAVVAQEVRALARRSADAAKEIKELLSSSAGQVRSGGRLVAETGEAIARIGQRIKGVDALVSAIAAEAGEQAQGLKTVGKTMADIDATARQNVQTAERFAAAGRDLTEDWKALAALVTPFHAGEPVADMVRPEMHFAAASADAQHRIQSPRPATLGANALALEAGE